jgi:hypothetical protein
MKDWIVARKLQFLSHWPNMFEDPKGALKCGSKLLVVVVFE